MSKLVAAEIIATKILIIRGKRVMLDTDLAMLYAVKTGRLNEQVSRNIKRFPEDFMFQLTKGEVLSLKSHFATSSWGGIRKLPRVFTQEGVAMLYLIFYLYILFQDYLGYYQILCNLNHYSHYKIPYYYLYEILPFQEKFLECNKYILYL